MRVGKPALRTPVGGDRSCKKWKRCPSTEACRRNARCLQGPCHRVLSVAKFVSEVRLKGVLLMENLGDRRRKLWRQATVLIDLHQFLQFLVWLGVELDLLSISVCLFSVCLGANGNVLANRHGQGPRGERGPSGRQKCISCCPCSDEADEKRCGRHEPIVRSEDGCPEPPRTA